MHKKRLKIYVIAVVIVWVIILSTLWFMGNYQHFETLLLLWTGFLLGMFAMYIAMHFYFENRNHTDGLKIKKLYKSSGARYLSMTILVLLIIGLYQMHKLRIAHSSFDNYYNFRGCVQLLEKTDTYGTCKTSSGQTIKLINIGEKWYLDGDGPGVF